MLTEPDAFKHKTKRALEIATELQLKAENRRRSEQPVVSQEDLQTALQFMLPLFQQDERGMPNALARGAIFNAAKTGETVKRVFHENRLVASLSNMRVEYQGQELRQDDCSVFMALLFYQREVPLGDPIYFTA